MAVTVDQANIGTAAGTGKGTGGAGQVTFNTTAAVAVGGMIALLVGKFDNTTGGTASATVTGPGAFTVAHSTASGNYYTALLYVFCPSGLSSGTTVTISFTGGSVASADVTVCAASYLGVDTSGTVIAFNATGASTAAWASGTVAATSGNALIGGAGGDGTLSTSTPTSPAVEEIDFNSATTGGTWSNAITNIGIAACFKAATGVTAAAVMTPAFNAIPFVPFTGGNP
jgi:hypothetical protein